MPSAWPLAFDRFQNPYITSVEDTPIGRPQTGTSVVEHRRHERYELYSSPPAAQFTLYEWEIHTMLNDVRSSEGARVAWENRHWAFVSPLAITLGFVTAAISLVATPGSSLYVQAVLWLVAGGAAIITAWVWAVTARSTPEIPEDPEITIQRMKKERLEYMTVMEAQVELGTAASSTIESGGTYSVEE